MGKFGAGVRQLKIKGVMPGDLIFLKHSSNFVVGGIYEYCGQKGRHVELATADGVVVGIPVACLPSWERVVETPENRLARVTEKDFAAFANHWLTQNQALVKVVGQLPGGTPSSESQALVH